ncbi:MAG: hypothetical protein NVSMB19_26350 [Vulcanimicrobiaceae bacterium]
MCIVAAAIVLSFYGTYAIDDSFIGFVNARHLAEGFGLTFNRGERLLTTSAPIVAPFYAVGWRLGLSILTASQIVSAISIVAIALAAYAVARRFARPIGACAATLVLLGSPTVTLLWSHETLVWMALTLVALAFLSRAETGAGALLGLACLARPEGLLVAAACTVWIGRTRRPATTIRFALLAFVPIVGWSAFAVAYYGTAISHSALAKHAQLAIAGYPYLRGLIVTPAHLYRQIDGGWANVVFGCALAVVALRFRSAARSLPVAAFAVWCTIVTTSYALAGTHYFVWYGLQIPASLAVGTALAWPCVGYERSRLVVATSQIFALAVVAVSAFTLVRMVAFPQSRYNIDDDLVMSRLTSNAYRSLGSWFARTARPNETIAYTEIGQLAYFSDRTIVDTMGLATASVPEHLVRGDGNWTFERFRPTYVVQAPLGTYATLDPREEDWFATAYGVGRRVAFRDIEHPDPEHDTFDIFRLVDARAIPEPGERDDAANATVRVQATATGARASFVLATAQRRRLQVRLRRADCSVGRLAIRDFERGRIEATRDFRIDQPIERISLPLPIPAAPTTYELEIVGCPISSLAPPHLRPAAFGPFADVALAEQPQERAIAIVRIGPPRDAADLERGVVQRVGMPPIVKKL